MTILATWDEVSAAPPEERERFVRGYLEEIVKLRTRDTEMTVRAAATGGMYVPDDWKYRCYEDLVLREGRFWTPQALPKRYKRRMPKACFRNALDLASSAKGLRYVEGFALPRIAFPTEHAWCVDLEGNVVDPTWEMPEICTYVGIEFPLETVRKMALSRGQYSVLGSDYMDDFKLLREGVPA